MPKNSKDPKAPVAPSTPGIRTRLATLLRPRFLLPAALVLSFIFSQISFYATPAKTPESKEWAETGVTRTRPILYAYSSPIQLDPLGSLYAISPDGSVQVDYVAPYASRPELRFAYQTDNTLVLVMEPTKDVERTDSDQTYIYEVKPQAASHGERRLSALGRLIIIGPDGSIQALGSEHANDWIPSSI